MIAKNRKEEIMYYLTFKDLLEASIKSIIMTSTIVGLSYLCVLDYRIGEVFCKFLNIPKNLALTMVSPGMAVEVCIILFVFELIGLYFIVRILRRYKTFNNLCEFISL